MLIPRNMPLSLRHKHNLQEPERRDRVNVVLSAFECFRSTEPVGYLSIPITSGKIFYEVLEKYGVKTREYLLAVGNGKDIFFREVITPNTEIGIALGDKLAKEWGLPIIVPAVFEAKSQRWTDNDYLHVWYQVIREMVGHTIMIDGWEYSNGGVQEFTHSIQLQARLLPDCHDIHRFPKYLPIDLYPDRFSDLGIEFPEDLLLVTDQRKYSIRIEKGAELITKAITCLYLKGFRTPTLMAALMHLMGMAHCLHSHWKSGKYQARGIEISHRHIIDMKKMDEYWNQAILVTGEVERDIYDICHD